MTNKTFAVVGKVINGQVRTIVATEDRVVGHIRPMVSTRPAVRNEVIEVAPTEVVRTVEPLDVPYFMKERTQRMQQQPKVRKRKKVDWFDRLHGIKGEWI